MDFKDCDGVDSVKDANAEAGRKPYDREGYYDAKRMAGSKKTGMSSTVMNPTSTITFREAYVSGA